MNTREIISTAEAKLIHTYNRYPVVLDHGEGVRLYDTDGKEYLDFGAGIAVFALGYSNEPYKEALKEQIDKLIHTSNYFYNEPAMKAAVKVTQATGMDRVFFTNSGTEAIEGAIKLAKKWAYLKSGCGSTDHEIIAMKNSFHGRSMGALAVTGNRHYQEAFGPMIPGIRFAEYNNLESVKSLVNDKTCAIILETVQGEGGVHPATEEFLTGIRRLCDEKGILMILDEVQCGMGRTGSMFAYQHYGVTPDIVSMAKALGCGVPLGAFAAKEDVAQALVPGDHGSTYGGNPLACAACVAVFEQFEALHVVDNVKKVGAYMTKRFDSLTAESPYIQERRGMGLLQGLELTGLDAGKVAARCLEEGLILFTAAGNTLRFVPPLIITEADVDECVNKLRKALTAVAEG
ncbi:MAG: aspartate aminotransferase family protein [Lachnospira sp.]|nr:aspartate aminotransferase family protein [Lachnospira sp.]